MKNFIYHVIMVVMTIVVITLFILMWLIDKIEFNFKGFDFIYKFMEHWSNKINTFAWQKRWGNRKEGTGYAHKSDNV